MRNIILNKKGGQVITELLVAGGLFSLIIVSIMGLVLDSYRATNGGEEDTTAMFLAQEGLDATRAIRDDAWLNLTAGNHGLTHSLGYWQFIGTSDITGKYTRVISILDVNRDSPYGNINLAGGNAYGRTKKITATVTWTTNDISRSAEAVAFFDDWNVFDWFQTSTADFTGGTFTNSALTGSGNSASLILATTQVWTNAAGTQVTHQSSTDFTGGTFGNTTLIGTGVPVTVQLATSTQWGLFTDTGNEVWNEVFMVSINDGWVVGNAGATRRWDGISWNVVTSGSGQNLNSIYMVSANDGWAVGASGVITRWNGTAWSLFVDTGAQIWSSVHMVSATDGWLVGSAGEIRRWNGTAWNLFVDTGSDTWNSVYMVSATDGWVVSNVGVIRRWNGIAWNVVTSPTSNALNTVYMVSATDGWAAGGSGTIIRWDGANWTLFIDTGTDVWNKIHMVSSTDGWMVGSGGVMRRWNGTAWNSTAAITAQNLDGLFMVSAINGWAVAAAGALLEYGDLYAASGTYLSNIIDSGIVGSTWNSVSWSSTLPAGTTLTVAIRTGPTPTPDGSWSAFTAEMSVAVGSAINVANNRYAQYRLTLATTNIFATPSLDYITIIYNAPTNQDLNSVFMVSANDGWAAGASGAITRWNGTSWNLFADTGTDVWNKIFMVSSTDGWMVGDGGVIRRWNGTAWNSVTSPTANNLASVYMVSATDGWAVGAAGFILHWNGTAWSLFVDTGNEVWNEVYMVSATDGWVVGNGGVIRRFNGTVWNSVTSPTAQNLNSIYMLSATDGWAVGASGVIIRWNGTAWSLFVDTGAQIWTSVHMVSINNGWTVSTTGEFYAWDGVSWTLFLDTGANPWNGVFMISANNGWAVGGAGGIYHYISQYTSSGTFISSVLNTDSSVNRYFQSVFWSEILPVNTDVTVATRSGSTAVPDISWSAFSAETSSASGAPILSANARYLQYRVTLTTNDTTVTPSLDDITITYK